MSVQFIISGENPNFDADACPVCVDGEWQTCRACDGSGFSADYRAGKITPRNFVDMTNVHAVELLAWLGFEIDREDQPNGVLLPGDLRARCARRLASTPANVASDLPRAEHRSRGAKGARLLLPARRTGYLADKARALLELAERAGDRAITYS
jgi:hypothetical protein